MDQPVRRRTLMRTAHNVYAAFRAHTQKSLSEAAWSEAYPDLWKIVAEVEKEILSGDQSEPD